MSTSATDRVSALLPLKPADYMILFVLLDRELYGYRMVKEIAERSDGQIRLEAGNLYRSIRRMIKQELIDESDRRPAPESDDERRRYYAITDFGRRVVAADTARMRTLVATVDASGMLSDPADSSG